MLKIIRDRAGRFATLSLRIFRAGQECASFSPSPKRGTEAFPLSTDDLTVLIEQHAGSINMYADLSYYGEDVEGVTEFRADHDPIVVFRRR